MDGIQTSGLRIGKLTQSGTKGNGPQSTQGIQYTENKSVQGDVVSIDQSLFAGQKQEQVDGQPGSSIADSMTNALQFQRKAVHGGGRDYEKVNLEFGSEYKAEVSPPPTTVGGFTHKATLKGSLFAGGGINGTYSADNVKGNKRADSQLQVRTPGVSLEVDQTVSTPGGSEVTTRYGTPSLQGQLTYAETKDGGRTYGADVLGQGFQATISPRDMKNLQKAHQQFSQAVSAPIRAAEGAINLGRTLLHL